MSKVKPEDVAEARTAALRVLSSGLLQTPVEGGAGRVEEPVPIWVPEDEEIAGWMVGIAVEDRLAGFLQLAADRVFRRYASFQRYPPSLEGCPALADWLDRSRIADRARSKAKPGEELAEPFLTYDQNPDRLAWAVRATDRKGNSATIWVAGEFVYR